MKTRLLLVDNKSKTLGRIIQVAPEFISEIVVTDDGSSDGATAN